MEINTYSTKHAMGKAAAHKAAEILKQVIVEKGEAAFVVATGASQFEFLANLTADKSIDWSKTTMFHLDEYVGIPETHPASFRNYLKKRFISKTHPGTVYLIEGDAEDPFKECERLNKTIKEKEIDVSFVGIGENGHLAFNDPPADFEIETPFLLVNLDEACRKQQLGEGWFQSLEDVPKKAISMSIKQIMKSKHIICTVPDHRKADAVKKCFRGDSVSPQCPASILKSHKKCFLFLDKQAAMYLD